MHNHNAVAGFGLPENEQGQQRANATGPLATTPTLDSGGTNAAAQAQKKFATCQARAALAGVTLIRLEGDDGRPKFIASRWALTKNFDNINLVDVWLTRVTGAAQ